jgi:hypothetical protein
MNNRIIAAISAALALSAATALFAPGASAQPQTKELLNMKMQTQGKVTAAQPKRVTKLPNTTNKPPLDKQVKSPPYPH